jgi:hypothetical protein
MRHNQPNRSRRILLHALAIGVPATLCFPVSPAQADGDKMTKARAEYQDSPNGIYSCGNCTLFVAPSSCKVVEGEISKDGWCKAFALAD